MNTNDSHFLKAYNELVSAFFNFMNVVNPQGYQQPNLSYVASQLNQLLNYLAAVPQVAQPSVQQPLSPSVAEAQTQMSTVDPAQNPSETVQIIQVQPQQEKQMQQAFKSDNAKTKYCAYPELINGRYKFKSAMISEEIGDDSVYKLSVDEDTKTGFVEIQNLTGDLLKTVINNPSLYTPLGVCPEAGSITPETTSVSSSSKLCLVKALRGWEIAEGTKFDLIIR